MRLFLFIGTLDLLTITEKLLWSVAIVSTFLLLILTAVSFFDEVNRNKEERKKGMFKADAKTILLFFTFFGWSSILAHLWEPSLFLVIIYGLPIGFIAAFAPSLIAHFKPSTKHILTANDFNLQEALSSTGEVLQYIPPHDNGRGTVHLNLRNAPYQINAVSKSGELPVGVPVRVVALLDKNTLVVEPLDGRPPHLPPQ